MSTPTIAAPIAFDQMLDLVIPSGGYLKLTAGVAGDEHASWFRKLEGQWVEQAVERPRPGFQDLLTRHCYSRVRFSPVGWRTMFTDGPSFVLPLTLVWASIPLARVPVSLAGGIDVLSGAFRIGPESTMRAQAIVDAALPPSAVLDEGDRLSPLWLLTEPITADHAARLLAGIATKLGLARGGVQAEPHTARLGIPGTTSVDLIPAKVTAVEAWHPHRRYPATELERWSAAR